MLLGCVAPIREERSFGPAWPGAGAATETTQERRDAGVVVRASASGATLDVAVVRVTECRTVTVTAEMFREVEVRRSFSHPEQQERNFAMAILLLTGAGLVAFSADALACPRASGNCKDLVSSAAAPIPGVAAGLSLIPVAFAAINAILVQGTRRIERTPAATDFGAWSPCETRPLADEKVTVSVGDRQISALTGVDGHAAIEAPALAPSGAASAVVTHAGSPEVTVPLVR
jgi:hypothetical protein